MLRGDLGAVATIALTEGEPGLAALRLRVGRPLQPMLAQPAADIAAALAKVHPAAVEWKLDGARIQVHRDGHDVAVFTRTLDDVTARVPEIVEAALALDVTSAVLDGEAIALRPDGRPHPFQVTGVALRQPPATSRTLPRVGPADRGALRRPARRRRGPARPPGRGAHRDPRRDRRRPRCACRARSSRTPRRRRRCCDDALARGPRGRDGQVARRALRGRAPRRGLAEGQAVAHARPRRARRRVGPRPPARVAQQPPPRRARPGRAGS